MATVPDNAELNRTSSFEDVGGQRSDSETEQRGRIHHRRLYEPTDSYDRITHARHAERRIGDLPSPTIPGLTIAQVIQIRKLVNARKIEETWWQRHAISILLVVVISAFAGVAWKRIDKVETGLLSKTIDIGLDVALTIIENNPEFLGEDKIAGILHLAERCIQQTYKKDISDRLGKLISTAAVSSENLFTLANGNLQSGQNLRAMTLYKLSYRLFTMETNSPDDVARRIGLTVALLCEAASPLIVQGGASRQTAILYGVRYAEDLLNELLNLKDTTSSVKALAIGRCSVDLTRSLTGIGELEKAIRLTEDGIEVMENEFQEYVSEYQYYGYVLNNQGTAYEAKKEFIKAAISYAKAIEAKNQAVDYQSEENKKADIEMTKNNLARAQAKLYHLNGLL